MDIVTRTDWQRVAVDAGAVATDAQDIRRLTATFQTPAAAEDAHDALMAVGFSCAQDGCEVWGGPSYMQDSTTGEFTLPERP